MTLFGNLPAPLRPPAVRMLAAMFPFFRPASLDAILSEAFERERRVFADLSRGWTGAHWSRLGKTLAPAGTLPPISNLDEALRQVAFEVRIEGVPFQIFDGGAGRTPRGRPTAGALCIAPAVLRVAMKQTADAIAREENESRIRAAERRILAEEQRRSAGLAADCQSWLATQRADLSVRQEEIARAAVRSAELAAERRNLLRDLGQQLARAETYAQRGEQNLGKLSDLQELRRREMDRATQGDGLAFQKVLELDARCEQLLTAIARLGQNGEAIAKAIDACNQKLKAVERNHREQAEKLFDVAVAGIRLLIRETETLLGTLGRHADSNAEWVRIATRLQAEGADARRLEPQYRALGLWQLGTAPDHPAKKAAAQAAEKLRADARAIISGPRRPVLE